MVCLGILCSVPGDVVPCAWVYWVVCLGMLCGVLGYTV